MAHPDFDDSFWNVETLLPKGTGKKAPVKKEKDKEKSSPPVKKEKEPSLKENRNTEKKEGKGELFPTAYLKKEKTVEYHGDYIAKVDVYPWPNHYSFFSNFKKNAEAVFHLKAESAPQTPFFSFMPQFHQLTASQLRYYLYFKECFKKGQILPCDFSYLLLYIYEIINLPHLISPEEGAELLSKIWISYRKPYPKLDKYLSEWLPDYCLLHNVHLKKEIFEKIALYGRHYSTFPEFYMEKSGPAHCEILLSSPYSYETSKYRTKENKEIFDLYIPGGMNYFEEKMTLLDSQFSKEKIETEILRRTSYDGAVCAYSEKKQMEIEYTPYKKGYNATVVGDAVRYCENQVRRVLGIRARMSTPSLSPRMKAILDSYFGRVLPKNPVSLEKKNGKVVLNIPDYEEKYEADNKGFSFEKAREIENSSVDVAIRLGAAFEEEEESEEKEKIAPAKLQKDRIREGLSTLVEGGSPSFIAYAKKEGLLPSTLCALINEEALERFSDIAIEESEGTFLPLPDYEEEIETWIKN